MHTATEPQQGTIITLYVQSINPHIATPTTRCAQREEQRKQHGAHDQIQSNPEIPHPQGRHQHHGSKQPKHDRQLAHKQDLKRYHFDRAPQRPHAAAAVVVVVDAVAWGSWGSSRRAREQPQSTRDGVAGGMPRGVGGRLIARAAGGGCGRRRRCWCIGAAVLGWRNTAQCKRAVDKP